LSTATLELTHEELSLLLFALQGREGGGAAQDFSGDDRSCESACPVADHFEALFDGGEISSDKKLIHHLNTHLREGLIECGAFELMASAQANDREVSAEEHARMRRVNERLKGWRCEMKLDKEDRRLLYESMSRLPRAAWLSMPRTIWRLKKKLKPLS
jgi:hypothetical protein